MRAEHVDFEAVALSRIRAVAGGAKTMRIVILDSCRNNPFAAHGCWGLEARCVA